MVAIGAYLVVHALWAHGRPVTQSIWIDLAFAALFILRGMMNLRRRRSCNVTSSSSGPRVY
jgi:hypothetical protein